MEVSTAAQPSSGHQKRYIPIVAGTLGGCGLALIVGDLLYLFLRRRRQRFRREGPVTSDMPHCETRSSPRFLTRGSYLDDNLEGESVSFCSNIVYLFPPQSVALSHAASALEFEDLAEWNVDEYLSGLDALPFANFDLETNYDLEYQNLNASAVPASPDLGANHEQDPLAGCDHSGELTQPETLWTSPFAPSASISVAPNDVCLNTLRTNIETSISHPPTQAPPKPESLPLPPAPTLRCPNCPRKFSSRARLE